MAEEILIRGGTAVTMDEHRRVGAFDVRVRDGVIVEVGADLKVNGPTRVLDAKGCAVVPGLVHSHLHLCQVLFRNHAEDRPLLPWLSERIWPLEAAHDPTTLRTSAELGLVELLLSGATCALDMGTVNHHDAVFEAAGDLGFRLVSGKAMMDVGDDVPDGLRETTANSVDESDRLHEKWNGARDGLLHYAYAPRFVPSCSDELLAQVARRVEAGGRLHTHASENLDEVALVKRTTGLDNVDYLAKKGLLSKRSVLAHAVHLAPGEIGTFAKAGASVAHCPSANLKLASGIADVPALIEGGVNVGLGADGAPCNNNLDVWRELKLAGLLPRLKYGAVALGARDVFELATLGGARAVGLADRIGSLEPGKRADLAIVDLETPHAQPVDDVYTALVYAVQAADVRTVLVDGVIRVKDRRVVGFETGALLRRVRRDRDAVFARAGL